MHKNPTVLLVEDDLALRQSLRRGLQQMGCSVLVGADKPLDGPALERIELIVIDVTQPDPAGLSALHQLRREGAQIPIIALSSAKRARRGKEPDTATWQMVDLACEALLEGRADSPWLN